MMVRLGVPFSGAHLVGWRNVAQFAHHLDDQSATYRAQHPDEHSFASTLSRASIMAATFDALMCHVYNYAAAHGYKGPRPKRYPRPWASSDNETSKFGSGAIPVADFDAWYYGKEA